MSLHEVIWPNKYLLMTVGLWPMRADVGLARRGFANLRFFVGLFAVTFLLVPEFMSDAVNWGDIGILRINFGWMRIVHFLLMLKLLYYKWRQRGFRSMYQHLKNFWLVSDDPQERRLYERPAHLANLATIAFYLMGMCNLLNFEIIALFDWMANRREVNDTLRHRPLLVEYYYGIDTQRMPTYGIVLISQNLCSFCAINAFIGCDCTILVFTVHVFAQFKLIAARFHTVGRTINEQLVAKNELLRFEIGKLVAQHQHTIRVAEELNSLLSPVMFCQIMGSGLQICLGGYALIEGNGSLVDIFKFLAIFLTLLIQLVVFYAPANLLIQESSAIAETIYHEVAWFNLTPSLQRDLGFVMMRAQKACHVTVFYQVMSIRRIMEVFNTAGSYMTLLRRMKN